MAAHRRRKAESCRDMGGIVGSPPEPTDENPALIAAGLCALPLAGALGPALQQRPHAAAGCVVRALRQRRLRDLLERAARPRRAVGPWWWTGSCPRPRATMRRCRPLPLPMRWRACRPWRAPRLAGTDVHTDSLITAPGSLRVAWGRPSTTTWAPSSASARHPGAPAAALLAGAGGACRRRRSQSRRAPCGAQCPARRMARRCAVGSAPHAHSRRRRCRAPGAAGLGAGRCRAHRARSAGAVRRPAVPCRAPNRPATFCTSCAPVQSIIGPSFLTPGFSPVQTGFGAASCGSARVKAGAQSWRPRQCNPALVTFSRSLEPHRKSSTTTTSCCCHASAACKADRMRRQRGTGRAPFRAAGGAGQHENRGGRKICAWLAQNGYFYVMHRFDLDNVRFVRDMRARAALPRSRWASSRPTTTPSIASRPKG